MEDGNCPIRPPPHAANASVQTAKATPDWGSGLPISGFSPMERRAADTYFVSAHGAVLRRDKPQGADHGSHFLSSSGAIIWRSLGLRWPLGLLRSLGLLQSLGLNTRHALAGRPHGDLRASLHA